MTPDRWLALTIRISELSGSRQGVPEVVREQIPQLLIELGGRGVEEKAGEWTTYLPPPEDLQLFLDEAQAGIDRVAPEGLELTWGWQPQEDWESLWRKGLGPRRITPRLRVAPTWDIPDPEPGEILITLDPGMAFGTAEHATTRGCLRLLDSRIAEQDRIADIGSGSGILSIAAARMGACEVLAVEVDPMACEAAQENLEANGVEDRVRILTEELHVGTPLPDGPFHGVVANIQRFILLPLLPGFKDSVLPGGWIILSGILLEERDEVISTASGLDLALEEEDQEGEWWSGAFRLPVSSARE